MTAIYVCLALIAANVGYAIYDNRKMENLCQMDDYYRVEFKKTYNIAGNKKVMPGSWY